MTTINNDPERGEITIKDISHVLNLLISNLYGGDPHLTIRELIQNAHDAIVEKCANGGTLQSNEILIEVNPFDKAGYLDITDTGAGMTRDELRENLGKIGDSKKLNDALINPAIIGRFGIGFLSSFIVADEVEVTTRNNRDGEVWRWHTINKTHWTLARVASTELTHPGTRVRLFFKRNYDNAALNARVNDLKSVDGLKALVQKFAYLIPIPIKVKQDGISPIVANAVRLPWEDKSEAAAAYSALFQTRDQAMYTHVFRRVEGAFFANGVLYFRQPQSLTSSLRLYVKRMLVNPEDSDLLPRYGIFATGLVDSPSPEVDLARRHVSSFDPAYRWLRKVVHEELEKAFIAFAQSQADTLATDLWPRVDNSFIARLLDAEQNGDDIDKAAVDSFLLHAGPHIPFYQVDTISGGFGRPVWKTLQEMAAEKKAETRTGEKVTIPYTDSNAPVEKELLVAQYSKLIDVGREERSHAALMTALTRRNAQFPDFQLERVTASQFQPVIDQNEHKLWASVIKLLENGLYFTARNHQVLVEYFKPDSTPVSITDTNVDSTQVESLKNALRDSGALGGAGDLSQMLSNFLEQTGKMGGMVTVHVNAGNPLMLRLRDAISETDGDVAGVASDGLRTIAWRAVLDYFGWRSTRDMIARDREYSYRIINTLLDRSAALEEARREETELAVKVANLEAENANMNNRISQLQSSLLTPINLAVVGIIDIVSSTDTIMANANLDAANRAKFMVSIIEVIQERLDPWVKPVSFTGDGLLFYITAEARGKGNLLPHLLILANILQIEAERFPDIRRYLGHQPTHLRIAMSCGAIQVGTIGPTTNIVGLPVVEAARLATEDKQAFDMNGGVGILVNGVAFQTGCEWGLWPATAGGAAIKTDWHPKGVGGPAQAIYRLSWGGQG